MKTFKHIPESQCLSTFSTTGQPLISRDIFIMEEIWKEVPNFNGIYFASNTGIVKSVDHLCKAKNGKQRTQIGRILKPSICKKGYFQISLSLNGVRLHTSIHRAVALAFIPNPNNLPQVNHKDGNKLNNNLNNLEWCTNQENQVHAVKNNLVNHNYGERHHMAKLKNSDILILIDRIKNGETMSAIAKEFGMSVTAVSNIYHKRTYININ